MEDHSIILSTKPGASLKISVYNPSSPKTKQVDNPLSDILIVFLNGLVLPRSSWSPAISHLIETRTRATKPLPAILAYDRYGQGDSDPDPTDYPPETPYGHDANSVVSDLDQLLTQLSSPSSSSILQTPLQPNRLILVCNSIGCPLARLYATTTASTTTHEQPKAKAKPHQISAILFLDSMMANTDFVSLFPDPDAPGFDPDTLPRDVSPEDLRHARSKFREYFHPTVPNPEKFDRRNLRELLPYSDKPLLPSGPNGEEPPRLVVVGHDWDEFAEQCEQVRLGTSTAKKKPPRKVNRDVDQQKGSLSVPKAVTNAYLNPAWGAYNEGLARLSDNKANQVKIAKGCGHFIQKDDPVFVATEISNLLDDLTQSTTPIDHRNTKTQ